MLSRLLDSSLRLLAAGDRPAGRLETLQCETIVPVAPAQAFAFFSEAQNLERLTPAWLNFRIHTPLPIEMRDGTIIDYVIDLYGVPMPWRTRIDTWEPGARFVDRQVAGPYRWWHHEHRFEEVAGGTRVIDRVEYLPRAAWLSARMVRRDVGRIFEFRQAALGHLLHSERTSAI